MGDPQRFSAAADSECLAELFRLGKFQAGQHFVNHQLAANTIPAFRGSDDRKRTVLLMLSRVAASIPSDDKKGPRPPPLSLELSHILDAAHPDVFRVSKGQF